MKQVAIIGCGRIASRHAANIERIGHLVAACDIVEERANKLAIAYNAKAYYSVDELLAAETAVDLVVVCTPNGLHAEHIIKSLQARKDVLTEKPFCLTKAAAWQIIETEKFCRKRLFLVQSVRYNPLVQALKKLLHANVLGQIYSFHLNCIWNRPAEYFTGWHGKLFPDGGLLYNQFSHYLDALLLLFGDVEDARGFTANAAHQKCIEFEDGGAAALQMQTGVLGTLNWSVNAFQKNFEIGLTIIAEKATVRIGGEYLNKVQAVQSAAPLSLVGFEKGSIDFHAALYQDLSLALPSPNKDFPGCFDGLKTVETIEKIYKATR